MRDIREKKQQGITNPSFNLYGWNSRGRNNEARVIHNLVEEAIKIYGFPVLYLPRTRINNDKLFGEDTQSLFQDAIPIEMYLETTQQWDGLGDFMSKFGALVKDSGSLHVARWRFREVTKMLFPREGDFIYFYANPDAAEDEGTLVLNDGRSYGDGRDYLNTNPDIGMNACLWEITFLEDQQQFYPLGEQPSFKLKIEVAELAGETFRTGNEDLDSLTKNVQLQTMQTLEDLEDMLESGNKNIQDESDNIVDKTEIPHRPFGDF